MARVDELSAELTRARSRSDETHAELTRARARLDELSAELTQARARNDTLAADLTAATAVTSHVTELRARSTALREVLLTPDLAPEDLRTRLLAELLTDRSS